MTLQPVRATTPRLRVLCDSILTIRECEIIELLADGLSVKEAAFRLGIAPQTARDHMVKARHRLGFSTTVQMAFYLAAKAA